MDKTLAEINLKHLVNNVRKIREKTAPARVIAVVKADAYGHGAIPVARCLAREGIDFFAVAQFKEAMELRENGLFQPILIFERLFPDEISKAVTAGFRISLFSKEDIRWIERAGVNMPAYVHVNLDTGMGRVGLLWDREPDFFDSLIASNHCRWEGFYSHFATSDEADKTYAHLQLDRFRSALSHIHTLNTRPVMAHMANSGAVLDIPESYFDAIRPGILMYGHYPSLKTSRSFEPKQVMTLKTTVAHVRQIPAGYPVSYGRRWISPSSTTIAVLPIGYADGIRRDLTNTGEVLIRGRLYPMVGTVTMDSIMVDVGKDPIYPGDEAILWGESSQGSISLEDVAQKLGTIPYELTCGISQRVKRVYIESSALI